MLPLELPNSLSQDARVQFAPEVHQPLAATKEAEEAENGREADPAQVREVVAAVVVESRNAFGLIRWWEAVLMRGSGVGAVDSQDWLVR